MNTLRLYRVYCDNTFVVHVRARDEERAIATARPYMQRRRGRWSADRITLEQYGRALRGAGA